jgi:hypothetical protein
MYSLGLGSCKWHSTLMTESSADAARVEGTGSYDDYLVQLNLTTALGFGLALAAHWL